MCHARSPLLPRQHLPRQRLPRQHLPRQRSHLVSLVGGWELRRCWASVLVPLRAPLLPLLLLQGVRAGQDHRRKLPRKVLTMCGWTYHLAGLEETRHQQDQQAGRQRGEVTWQWTSIQAHLALAHRVLLTWQEGVQVALGSPLLWALPSARGCPLRGAGGGGRARRKTPLKQCQLAVRSRHRARTPQPQVLLLLLLVLLVLD